MSTTVSIQGDTEYPQERYEQAKRSATAGFFGAALEYYDFFVYAAAAALVFPKLFFAGTGSYGILLSMATFGVAYIARPLGGMYFGHLGDKIGRKKALIITLMLMGLSTFLMGCLPTYDTMGIMAPVLLVILRLLQGFSVGGELANSSTLTLEHAPPKRRAFFISWNVTGIWLGYIVAAGLNIVISNLPEESLMSWGWRIPFLFSIIICFLGFYFRLKLEESEAFTAEKESGAPEVAPIKDLFRTHLGALVSVIVGSLLIVSSATVPLWGLSYAVNTHGIPRSTTLSVIIFGYAMSMLFQPFYAHWADKIGRKPVMIYGNIGGAISCFLFFWAVATANVTMMYVGIFLSISVFFSATNAVYLTFFGEKFNVRVRASGLAIGVQLGILATGFSPAIVTALVDRTGSWLAPAIFTATALLISTVAIAMSQETYNVPLDKLGNTID